MFYSKKWRKRKTEREDKGTPCKIRNENNNGKNRLKRGGGRKKRTLGHEREIEQDQPKEQKLGGWSELRRR